MNRPGTGMSDPMRDRDALDWALRMAEPDADWAAFTAWLDAGAGRAAAYDEAVWRLEAVVARMPAAPAPAAPAPADAAANDDEPAAPPARGRFAAIGRRGWLGAALAAGIVAALGVGAWPERAAPYQVATAAGEQRIVALPDGSSIVLAGGSRIRLDRAAPRLAVLEAGQALFRVRHDASAPFRVEANGLTLVDLGTVFDVNIGAGTTRVAVSEGMVMADPDGAAVRLNPGQGLVADGAVLRRVAVDPAAVGGWRDGRLAYDGVALDAVAVDLSRHLGRRVVATPAVASRRFAGTLDTATLADDPDTLAALLGVRVRASGGAWILEPR